MIETDFELASLGPSTARTVVVLREGALATTDPDPAITRRRDIRVVAVRVVSAEVEAPGIAGGETPADVTVAALTKLVHRCSPEGPFAVVGVGGAGLVAVHLAALLHDRVDRLALVGVAAPAGPLERGEAERALGAVAAKTLVLAGSQDPDASSADARWLREHLRDARVEMVPARPGADDRLALSDVWERVLSHTAPGAIRPTDGTPTA